MAQYEPATSLRPAGLTLAGTAEASRDDKNLYDTIWSWTGGGTSGLKFNDIEIDKSTGLPRLTWQMQMTGISQDELNEFYETERRRLLNTDIKTTNRNLGRVKGDPLSDEQLSTMDAFDIQSRGSDAQELSGIRAEASLVSPEVVAAVDALGPNANVDDARSLVSQGIKTEAERTKDKDRKYDESLIAQQLAANHQSTLTSLEFQRQESKDNRDMQMMQFDYQNRRDERREDRNRRRDTLAMITQGLSNLGGAFAY